jgi:subtilisin family serine protease
MTWKTWVLAIASVLVSSVLLEGQVFAAGERKKIVMIDPSLELPQRQQQFDLLRQVLNNPLNGIKVVHTLSFIYALAIELRSDGTLTEALADLQNLLDIARRLGVLVDVYDDLEVSVLRPSQVKEAPLITQRYDWGAVRIGADVAHQEMPTLTGAGVKVAIVDTGVNCAHPDLPQPLPFGELDGFNALPNGGSYCDKHGHGTHIAGIITARMNSRGVVGVAPKASIAAVKVLDDRGHGFLSDLLNGLGWIYNNQIRQDIWLVNLSLGFSTGSAPLEEAIRQLTESGTLMVASAGNSCSDDPGQDEGGGAEGERATCDASQTEVKYPARYPGVLAVTATISNDEIATYSVRGPQVAVTAPGGIHTGERILSTYLNSDYAEGSGTSQAAAYVTGTLALKLQQRPTLSWRDVRQLLQQTATDLGYAATAQGAGLIDVECFLEPTLPQCPIQ